MNKVLILKAGAPVPNWLRQALMSPGLTPEPRVAERTAVLVVDESGRDALRLLQDLGPANAAGGDLPPLMATRVRGFIDASNCANDEAFGRTGKIEAPKIQYLPAVGQADTDLESAPNVLTIEYEV